MAYLETQTLTCPNCGVHAGLSWVIGEGPNTRPGEGPAYISALDSADWRAEPNGRGVTIHCTVCGAVAATRACPEP